MRSQVRFAPQNCRMLDFTLRLPRHHGAACMSGVSVCVLLHTDRGAAIKATRGDAILFWTLKPSGEKDRSSLHGSCPTLKVVSPDSCDFPTHAVHGSASGKTVSSLLMSHSCCICSSYAVCLLLAGREVVCNEVRCCRCPTAPCVCGGGTLSMAATMR